MNPNATHVRLAGAHSAEWLSERERKEVARLAALDARIAATDPALREAAAKSASGRRR